MTERKRSVPSLNSKGLRMRLLICVILSGLLNNVRGQIDPSGIEIIRDQWGVPHIYAQTDAEVAYGLAWAHAEDDFKSIQQIVAASKVRLGEHLGKDGATVDYLMGLLRCKEVVDQHFDDLSPEFVRILEGYVAGLNQYASKHPKEIILKKLFPITTHELLQGYVVNLALFSGVGRTLPKLIEGDIDPVFEAAGSNGFAISREKTSDNYSYLAVNSHQPLEGPLAWYEAHLISGEGWNMLGGLFPGGCVIFHGTNEDLGWAHTVNYPDMIDVFQLEMNDDKSLAYRVDDEIHSLEEEILKLKVKLFLGIKINVKRKVYHSIYGPTIKNDLGYFSIDMGALHDIRAVEQWYRMNKAQSFEEYYDAMSMVSIPGFNTVYADKEGNIFYIGNAKIPYRKYGYNWRGVVPGNTTETLLSNYHPIGDLPQVYNPKSKYIFNTNHSAYISTGPEDHLDQEKFDPTMGYMLWNNNRSTRFQELISELDEVSWDDFLRIKYDHQLPDSIAYLTDINPLFEIDPSKIRRGRKTLEILQNWNRKAHIEEVGPAHLKIFRGHLRRKLNAPFDTIFRPKPEEMLESLAYTEDYFLKHFGKIDVTLGEFQFLIRGDKELPVNGIPDVITAMGSVPHKNGRVKAYAGECYFMMIRYPEDNLPIIETINVYGASNRPESPHYTDQMEMFLNQERKSMTLDIDEVRKSARRIYHPE